MEIIISRSKQGRRWILPALIVLFSVCVPGRSDAALRAVAGHSSFFLPASATGGTPEPFIELYWQVDPSTLPFVKEGGKISSKVKTDIVISTDTGILYQDHYILESTPLASVEEAAAQRIIDLRRFRVPAGKIMIELKLSDPLVSTYSFSYRDSLQVESGANKVFYSDIQMIDTIIDSDKQSAFQRNGRLQIPLCANFIGEEKKNVRYYAELYNTRLVPAEEYPIIQTVSISKKGQEGTLHNLVHIDTISANELSVVNGSFSTETLPSGNYNLNITLTNRLRQKLAGRILFFQLLNPSPTAFKAAEPANKDSAQTIQNTSYLNLNKTFAGKYTSSQVRAILKMLYPISDPNEKLSITGFLNKPDEMYMRYFIFNFWQRKDSKDPERAWKNYTEKVKEVNKLFGSSMAPGYETDRGMVYLKYGKPNEIVPVPNEEGALPYEIWQYDATAEQGTPAIFLFYRPGFMVNDYKLLHSTAVGEVRNGSWRAVLYPGGQGTNKEDSRAYQYFGNK